MKQQGKAKISFDHNLNKVDNTATICNSDLTSNKDFIKMQNKHKLKSHAFLLLSMVKTDGMLTVC